MADFRFIEPNAEAIRNDMVESFEAVSGEKLKNGDAEKLLIDWFAGMIAHERAVINHAASQVFPQYASGKSLDDLGVGWYGVKRKRGSAASCTMELMFSLSHPAFTIPAWIRFTDRKQEHFWAPETAVTVAANALTASFSVFCADVGTVGNGYGINSITVVVDTDVVPYIRGAENTTVTAGGIDNESDDDYRKRIIESIGRLSTAGTEAGYVYWTKSADESIADVQVNTVQTGTVTDIVVYALMSNGQIAGAAVKSAISGVLTEKKPLTDSVSVADGNYVNYDIDITYYRNGSDERTAAEVSASVNEAVNRYVAWQSGEFGRDINPSKLIQFVMDTGVDSVFVADPTSLSLSRGSGSTPPEVAKLVTKRITDGGTT